VQLTLTMEQALELRVLLDGTLREMSHEIAATDNAGYRALLVERRRHLAELSDALSSLLSADKTPEAGEPAVMRELARPGG
jgi:hypothetical protein